MCNEHKDGGLSLQLVSHTDATITLAPMCASCVVGFRKPKPPRPEREHKLAKRYTLWREMTKMVFAATSIKEERKRRWAYFKRMEAAMQSYDWRGAAWTSATQEERDLFTTGLSKALILRNKQTFAQGVKEARNAALDCCSVEHNGVVIVLPFAPQLLGQRRLVCAAGSRRRPCGACRGG